LAQSNLGNALRVLGERESGTESLQQAVAAFNATLQEQTRDRVPLDWARTQANLGLTLTALGLRESGTERLRQAVAAFDTCLKGVEGIWPPNQVNALREFRDQAQAELTRRTRRKG
jgi:tetratricopeptide (TPR) repeat protein